MLWIDPPRNDDAPTIPIYSLFITWARNEERILMGLSPTIDLYQNQKEYPMTRNQNYLIGGAIALLLLGGTAIAAYNSGQSSASPESMPVSSAQVTQPATPAPAPHRQYAQARPHCNDHNVIGTVGGAVAGGVLGNQFGKGAGKTVATVGGAAAGGYLGNEYIPTRGATCD